MRAILFPIFCSVVLVGCAAKRVETAQVDDRPTPKSQKTAEAKSADADADDGRAGEAPPPSLDVGPLYYELDSARLTPESMATLNAVADWLRAHKGARVMLSGHTCELGTSEYNLALGQQRAKVARDYLLRLGVTEAAIDTISYGEERPALSGAGEEVWSKNRRAEFDVSAANER